MRLLNKLARLGRALRGDFRIDDAHSTTHRVRLCRVEELESRRLMTAADVAPIHVGITELDPDSADKSQPNTFQVTFQGGGAGTELTQLEIDGSKAGGPLSVGDVIFDTASGGIGNAQPQPFTVIADQGFQVTSYQVQNDSSILVLNLSGFAAGDTLTFSIGAETVTAINPVTSAVSLDAVVSGTAFAGSQFNATFVATGYSSAETSGDFINDYDASFAAANQSSGTTLDLPDQAYSTTQDLSAYSAGAVAVVTQPPLPRDLKGVVFNDLNLNDQDVTGDPGVAGVTLSLWQLQGNTYVNTGQTATTDSGGNYDFPSLLPGTYQVVMNTPTGYVSVGSTAGTIDGNTDGTPTANNVVSDIVLQDGGCNCNCVNNNFAVAQPAAVSGYVYYDANDNGQRDAGEPGIGGVTLEIIPLNVVGTPPAPIQVVTNANGFYSATGLNPGTWEVVEETQPPGYLDGVDRAGTLGGLAINPGDKITNIFLGNGASGQEYDFGKLLPNSISGRVLLSDTLVCTDDPNPSPIAGVTLTLLNSQNQVVATTTSDSNGDYTFTGLPAGTYSVAGDAGPELHCRVRHGRLGGRPKTDQHPPVANRAGHEHQRHQLQLLRASLFDAQRYGPHRHQGRPAQQHQRSSAGGCHDPVARFEKQRDSNDNNRRQRQLHLRPIPAQYLQRPGVSATGYYYETAFAGTVGGTEADNHDMDAIALPLATDATQYNFCVVPPSSLTGRVMVNLTGLNSMKAIPCPAWPT